MFLIKIGGMVSEFHQPLYVSAKRFHGFLKSTNSLRLHLSPPSPAPTMDEKGRSQRPDKKDKLDNEQLMSSFSKNYPLLIIAEMETHVCFRVLFCCFFFFFF